eukprot:6189355-Pleurochrysis_carterae.AAC.2
MIGERDYVSLRTQGMSMELALIRSTPLQEHAHRELKRRRSTFAGRPAFSHQSLLHPPSSH